MPVNPELINAGIRTAENAVNTGMGLVLARYNDKRQLRQQGKLNEQQVAASKDLALFNYGEQYKMWEKTGPVGQMEQYKKAGLNPGLMYGMGGGGGQSMGSGGGSVSGAQAPVGGGEVGMAMQLGLMKAQKQVLESQANLNNVEATKKAGADTENIKADTANKVLEGIIKDYTGREAKDQYTEVKQPNRGIEAKTYQEELEARQGIAGTIYELWTEGKLKEKSIAEIEGLLLKNAQTREETRRIYKTMELLEENIKGAKLDNIIKDLEAKLMTETGIDRNSPVWLRILGRLFVNLTGK